MSDLVYPDALKRIRLYSLDNERLAKVRELLQRQHTNRLTDSDVVREALRLALGVLEATKK